MIDMKKKIYKWNEITYDTMKEVFSSFMNREDWTKGKVLEIQDPVAIRNGDHNCRFYIGHSINIYDWPEQPFLWLIKKISNLFGADDKKLIKDTMSLCIYKDGIPTIIPLFIEDKQCRVILASCFGDTLGIVEEGEDSFQTLNMQALKWYLKESDGTRRLDQSEGANKKYSGSEKYVRTRTLEYEAWEDMMKTKNIHFEEDLVDIK